MVTNHVWLQAAQCSTCLVTGLNSPDQNKKKIEFRNMHYKLHNVTSKLPLNSLTLPLSHRVNAEDNAKSLPLKLHKHYRGSCCSFSDLYSAEVYTTMPDITLQLVTSNKVYLAPTKYE